jgi:release factor glutamine methyltransferase
MITVLEVIKRTTEFLAGKGIEGARLNAEHLIGHGLGLKRMQLYLQFERPLTELELEAIRPLVRRRGQHEPLQYIMGEVEFSGLKLKVDRRALIPRPETEYLLELVVQRLTAPPVAILDLGTGSGAIALALAKHYASSQVLAVDNSTEALALAAENAHATGLTERVEFLPSDWFAGINRGQRFDLIVANPPYLSEQEVAEARPEVKIFEPVKALTPGGDGLSALNKIMAEAPTLLSPGGLLALETGITQHATLRALADRAGYARSESLPDLTGRDRYLFVWAKG